MVYLWLIVLGLCLGSFVNALVWRLHEQEELLEKKPKGIGKQLRKLSITRGRSMCTHCGHELAPKDLVPLFSWLWLRGRCRYCHKPIQDTPFTEIALPVILMVSYWAWPYAPDGWTPAAIAVFGLWAFVATGYLALAVYDKKWYILPHKIVLPVTILSAGLMVLLAYSMEDWTIARDAVIASLALFGLFYALYSIGDGHWIGGGDVNLAVSLGLLAGSPLAAALLLFIASVLGSIVALPGLIRGTRGLKSELPFGPFLIIAGVVVFLWGDGILDWYLGVL